MPSNRPLTLRERRKIETRELILSVAADMFSTRGYQDSSIDDIGESAGVSRATVYAYFKSKDAILLALIDQMWAEAIEIYTAFGSLPDWSARSIAAWLNGFAQRWQVTARRNRAASELLASSSAVFDEVAHRYHRLVTSVRADEARWAHFTAAEADARATMLVLMLQQVFANHFFSDPAADYAILVEHLTAAVRDLLRADQN